tara:strand:+ start:28152 stop:29525 length:1374 start_codon:yes stop_codon:yes gene_type:complete
MAKINFKAGSGARQRQLKVTPKKYRESRGRQNISQSDGIRPAFPMMPYGSLPVGFEDKTTEDNVVIPKGRIVSALTAASDMGDGTDYYGVPKGILGLMVPCNNAVARAIGAQYESEAECVAGGGTWNAGNDPKCTLAIPANYPLGVVEHDVYQDIRGLNLNYDMRNKNWGILTSQLIKIPAVDTYSFDLFLGEPAGFVAAVAGSEGGGENIAGSYTQAVVAFLDDGGGADAATTAFDAPTGFQAGSYTITSLSVDGVAQDIAIGAMDDTGVVTITAAVDIADAALADGDYAVIVGYTYDLANAGSTAPITDGTVVAGSGYDAVEKKYTFYTYNSEANQGDAGELLKSDIYGNFMPSSGSRKAASAVGYLMGIDFRFEKDLLDTVQSKYEADANFRVAGTGTMGVPQFLYNFAYEAFSAALLKMGTTWADKFSDDEATVIKNAVDQGVFGEAWIQLDI